MCMNWRLGKKQIVWNMSSKHLKAVTGCIANWSQSGSSIFDAITSVAAYFVKLAQDILWSWRSIFCEAGAGYFVKLAQDILWSWRSIFCDRGAAIQQSCASLASPEVGCVHTAEEQDLPYPGPSAVYVWAPRVTGEVDRPDDWTGLALVFRCRRGLSWKTFYFTGGKRAGRRRRRSFAIPTVDAASDRLRDRNVLVTYVASK